MGNSHHVRQYLKKRACQKDGLMVHGNNATYFQDGPDGRTNNSDKPPLWREESSTNLPMSTARQDHCSNGDGVVDERGESHEANAHVEPQRNGRNRRDRDSNLIYSLHASERAPLGQSSLLPRDLKDGNLFDFPFISDPCVYRYPQYCIHSTKADVYRMCPHIPHIVCQMCGAELDEQSFLYQIRLSVEENDSLRKLVAQWTVISNCLSSRVAFFKWCHKNGLEQTANDFWAYRRVHFSAARSKMMYVIALSNRAQFAFSDVHRTSMGYRRVFVIENETISKLRATVSEVMCKLFREVYLCVAESPVLQVARPRCMLEKCQHDISSIENN